MIVRAQDFWPRLDRSGGTDACWPWTGSRTAYGYGEVARWVDGKRRRRGTHRIAWELTHGPIPDGMQVLHHCDNRPCCNPAHLFLGTNDDNVADKVAKLRHRVAEGVPCAKLDASKVRAIRADPRVQRVIAAEYGVDPAVVSRVKGGVTWRSVA